MREEQLEFQEMNLNIRYDAPQEVWDKVPLIYEKLAGWMGYHNDIPYWFSFDEGEKHICASVEPSGFSFPDECRNTNGMNGAGRSRLSLPKCWATR